MPQGHRQPAADRHSRSGSCPGCSSQPVGLHLPTDLHADADDEDQLLRLALRVADETTSSSPAAPLARRMAARHDASIAKPPPSACKCGSSPFWPSAVRPAPRLTDRTTCSQIAAYAGLRPEVLEEILGGELRKAERERRWPVTDSNRDNATPARRGPAPEARKAARSRFCLTDPTGCTIDGLTVDEFLARERLRQLADCDQPVIVDGDRPATTAGTPLQPNPGP